MTQTELDLPLEDTPANRFMLWFLAGLVYLAILAFAVAGIADRSLAVEQGESGAAIISMPAPLDPQAAAPERAAVIAALLREPEVLRVDQVPSAEVMRMMGDDGSSGLALPTLIEVSFRPGTRPDLTALGERIRVVAPDAAVENAGRNELASASNFARTLRLLGALFGVLIVAASVAVVVVITRMSLDLHDDTVDLLKLMGAADSYVARQFELHAWQSGLRGGLGGFLAAATTIVGFVYGGRLLALSGVAETSLRPIDWLLLGCVPVTAALLVTLAARLTAAWALARLR